MSREPDLGTATARERLHWTIASGGRDHDLDLLPAVIRNSVRIELDGAAVGRLRKPSQQHPWRETSVTIDGRPAVVALIRHWPVMQTDAFVDGRSLLDGRTIAEARLTAPAPIGSYETWLGGLYRSGAPPRRPLVRGWQGLVVAASIAAIVVLSVTQPGGLVAGLVATVALTSLVAIWWGSWVEVAGRAHGWLLDRPALGDTVRVLGFFGVFIGYPIVSALVLAGLLRPLVD